MGINLFLIKFYVGRVHTPRAAVQLLIPTRPRLQSSSCRKQEQNQMNSNRRSCLTHLARLTIMYKPARHPCYPLSIAIGLPAKVPPNNDSQTGVDTLAQKPVAPPRGPYPRGSVNKQTKFSIDLEKHARDCTYVKARYTTRPTRTWRKKKKKRDSSQLTSAPTEAWRSIQAK